MRKLGVVLENCRTSDLLDVINRCRESDGPSNVGRASFKPVRRFLKCALFERDAYNHFTSAVPGRYGIQKLRASIKHADASWCTHLMSGERKEIAAQLLYIERHVPRTLSRVHQRERAHSPSFGAKLGDWIDCAQRIRDVGEGEKFYFWC